MGFLRTIHAALLARVTRFFRTREIARVFSVAHAEELKTVDPTQLPYVLARQQQELALIRAGRMDITTRKTWAFPFVPSSVNHLAPPSAKQIPYNLRQLSRTPVARRAINLIKNSVTQLRWDIRPIEGATLTVDKAEQNERIKIAKYVFAHPNNDDSFQTILEMEIEDLCVLGATARELQLTPDPDRPLKMWAVDTESIKVFAGWSEGHAELPRYAQQVHGQKDALVFYDDEIVYVKDNPTTSSVFGVSKMDVAFQSLVHFIGVQAMSGRAGADQISKVWLWWDQPQTETNYQIVRRHIQNEAEGQAKISMVGGMKKPEVLEIQATEIGDLLLPWQELLIRMIGNAFDMSATALGVEHDVNRAVGEVLADSDYRSAVVPMAVRLKAAFTRRIIHQKLGWLDLEFVFLNIDDPDLTTKLAMCQGGYSMNALTPDDVTTLMGWPKSISPFAKLTQFESMIVLAEAQAAITDASADKAAQRQAATQPTIPGGPPMPGGANRPAPGGNTLKSPPALTLPKFPTGGIRSTAQEIVSMSPGELEAAFVAGKLPRASTLLAALVAQDPSILEQMGDEVRKVFEDRILKEKQQPKVKLPKGLLKAWQKEQEKRIAIVDKRKRKYSDFIGKDPNDIGRPGGPKKRKRNR